MNTIRTKDLTIGYDNKSLVKNIHTTFKTGEFIGIVGKNGIGKSTFLRSITGIIEPISGAVFFDDVSVKNIPQKELAEKIGIVFSHRPPSLNLTVREMVSLGRYPYLGLLGIYQKVDKEIIARVIKKLNLQEIVEKKLSQLSDGQLQKTIIGSILCQNTDFILLDEPTTFLDIKNKIDIFQLLKELTLSGKGIIVSTHEISMAINYCDRFLCMSKKDKSIIEDTPKKCLKKGVLHKIMDLDKNTASYNFLY